MKWLIKRYWGNDNVCAISSLDLETLDGGGKETLYGIASTITITYENVITVRETASEFLKAGTVDKNKWRDNHEKYVSRKRHGNIIRKS